MKENSPLIVGLGETHVEVGVDGIEGVSHQQHGVFCLERPVPRAFWKMRLNYSHSPVHYSFSLHPINHKTPTQRPVRACVSASYRSSYLRHLAGEQRKGQVGKKIRPSS